MNSPQTGHDREAMKRATAATTDGTFQVATPTPDPASGDRWVFRIGGGSAIAGAILGLIGNLVHPVTPMDDPEGVARVIADSDIWVPVHLAIVLGIVLMLGGFVAIYHSIRGGIAGALARFGLFMAVAGATIGLVLVILDGVAARQLAQEWASATPDQRAIALGLVHANETINLALASLFNIVFAAATFILFGVAVAISDVYPGWLGWVVFLAGLGSIGAGLLQAYVGEPTGASRILTIIGPTVITLWLLVVGILLVRMGMGRARADVLVERSFMVPVPTANAWSALADVAGWPSWAPHIMEARVSPPGPVQAATAGTFRFRPVGRSRFVMTEFDPPRSWTWTGRAMGVTIDYQHRFETVSPQTTRLVWVVRSRRRAGVRARLFALVYARLIDRAIPRFVASVSPPPADPAVRMSRHQAIDSSATTSERAAP